MELYSGVDANGNLTTSSERWHHDDQKNEIFAQNATNALNFAQSKWQNEQDIKFWNMQNEYNSPSNQLKLIQEAGLNPLFFGSNIGSHSGADSLQSADMANSNNWYQSQEQAKMANVANLLSGLGSGAETLLKNKQVALESRRLDLETAKVNQEIKYSASKTSEADASTKRILKGIDVDDETIKSIRQQVAESQAKTRNLEEQLAILKQDNKLYMRTFEDRVMSYHLANRLSEAGIFRSEKDAQFVQAQYWNALKEGKVLDQEEIIKRLEAENAEAIKGGDREKGKAFEKIGQISNAFLDYLIDKAGLPSYLNDNNSRSTHNPNSSGDFYPEVWHKDDLSQGGRIRWKNGWKSKWLP